MENSLWLDSLRASVAIKAISPYTVWAGDDNTVIADVQRSPASSFWNNISSAIIHWSPFSQNKMDWPIIPSCKDIAISADEVKWNHWRTVKWRQPAMSMRRIFFFFLIVHKCCLTCLYNGLLRNTGITIYIVMWLMLIGILILQFSTGSENRYIHFPLADGLTYIIRGKIYTSPTPSFCRLI